VKNKNKKGMIEKERRSGRESERNIAMERR